MNDQERKQLENADKDELQRFVQQFRPDSDIGRVAKERLAKLRHEEMLSKPPWYRLLAIWISIIALIIAILSWLFPRS